MKEKLVIELIMLALSAIVCILVWKYMQTHMYTTTEAEEDAHLKRLFGDAWKEAKDL